MPASSRNSFARSRIQQDLAFSRSLRKSATSNPADPGYKPTFTKATLPSAVSGRSEAYHVVFVNGRVESVRLYAY